MGKFNPGTQIIYVPTHAEGDTNHPDCECGFVTSVHKSKDLVFCRYWRKDLSELRTQNTSELTPMENLVIEDSVPQYRVEKTLKRIMSYQL